MAKQKSGTVADRRPPPSQDPLFVNSVQKGVAVLEAFSREAPRLTLAQITRQTGLDKSAVQRFLHTFHELGYLRKDEVTKQYSLSPKILDLTYAYLYSDKIIEVAQPFMVDAHERTGATVNLAVLDGLDIILISRIPSRNVLSANIQIGFRLPAVYSASGRILAAFLPEDERDRLIEKSELRAFTPESVMDRDELRRIILDAARDGYAMTRNQVVPTDISVATPVIDGTGRPLAAISISVPSTHMSYEDVRKTHLAAAIEAARKTSLAMGAF